MRSPRESNVEVSVLDLSEVIEEATKHLQEKYPGCMATITHTWGVVETPDGLYALCNEGVGSIKPISIKNPLRFEIGAEWEEDGKKSFSMIPLLAISYTDEEVRQFPIARKENLATFIRRFGSRLEANFEEWNRALSNIVELETV